MDLAQLANLGEFIGGIAVVATLIYLAVQLRENTRITSAQLRQEISRMSTEVAVSTKVDELNYFTKSMHDPQSVSPTELRHSCLLFMGIVNYYETLFYARGLSEVDVEFWQSRRTRLANLVGPAEHSLWPMMKDAFGHAFQDFVDRDLLPSLSQDHKSWLSEG